MYIGAYSSEGLYKGFYIKDIHGENIPTPNIELSDSEWQEALTGNYKVINGKHTYAPYVLTVDEKKQHELSALDVVYQPQFMELSQALGMATISDNSDLIADIKADYIALKSEYDKNRGEIIG